MFFSTIYYYNNIFSKNKMNIKRLINECVLYEMRKAKIKNMIAEEIMYQLNEKKKKSRNDKETKKMEAQKFYNSSTTKKSEILYAIRPDLSSDSARSYDKYLNPNNKDYREDAPEELINKVLTLKKKSGL